MEFLVRLKELFKQSPPHLDEIRTALETRKVSKEALAELAIDFVERCHFEYHSVLHSTLPSVPLETMYRNYIVDALSLLLEFGLDPNTIAAHDNVLWSVIWMDAPNTAASALKLLLEHGGDPNHLLSSEGETLFDYLSFKVSYDEYTRQYFHTVQCWLLLMAFGARDRDGSIPVRMLGGTSVEIFRDIQAYDCEIEPLPQKPGQYGCWTMYIYHIETKERVAVYP